MPLIAPSTDSAGLIVATGTPSIIDPAHATAVILPSADSAGMIVAAGTPSAIDVPPLPPPAVKPPTPTGFRDRDIRHAIRDALLDTGLFDSVALMNVEDADLYFGDETRVVVVDEWGQDVKNMWDSNEIDDIVVDSHVKLSFITQSDDATRRDELIELMINAAYNTMIGASWLGETMPAFSSFGPQVKVLKVKPPQRQVDRMYTYRYMPGSTFDTTE